MLAPPAVVAVVVAVADSLAVAMADMAEVSSRMVVNSHIMVAEVATAVIKVVIKVVFSKVAAVTGKVTEAHRAHCCSISTLMSLDNTHKTHCTVDST